MKWNSVSSGKLTWFLSSVSLEEASFLQGPYKLWKKRRTWVLVTNTLCCGVQQCGNPWTLPSLPCWVVLFWIPAPCSRWQIAASYTTGPLQVSHFPDTTEATLRNPGFTPVTGVKTNSGRCWSHAASPPRWTLGSIFWKKKKQNTILKTTHTTDKLYLASNLFLYMLLIEISTVFCFALNILSKQKNNLEQLKELETEEKLNPKLP